MHSSGEGLEASDLSLAEDGGERQAGDDYIQGDADDLLRSTPKNPKKCTSGFKPYCQETAANDHIVGLERNSA